MHKLSNKMNKKVKLILAVLPLLAVGCSDDKKSEIVCWGDSLTAPSHYGWKRSIYATIIGRTDYPAILQDELGDSYDVINCGVGGENTLTIMARQGAAPMMLAHDITIYNDDERKYPMTIGNRDVPAFISTWDDSTKVTPLIQFGYEEDSPAKVNPCIIGGRKYELSADSKFWIEHKYVFQYNYYIKDKSPIDSTFTIKAGTKVETAAMRQLRNKYAYVFFVGQNGDFNDVADLTRQLKAMVKYSNSSRYIVVSFHKPNRIINSPKRMKEMEDSLHTAFGRHFINLRQHLIRHGLQEADITPTAIDKDSIARGAVPPSLLNDAVHFNAKGYKVLAQLIAKRFKELGY